MASNDPWLPILLNSDIAESSSNGTDSHGFNCDTISNKTYEQIMDLISYYTPSPEIIDRLNALCPGRITTSTESTFTLPYNGTTEVTTSVMGGSGEGMSPEEGLGIILGVAIAFILLSIGIGVILWKKRIIGRHNPDLEKGQGEVSAGDLRTISTMSNDERTRYERNVTILRSAHKDGTAPRANGLPTIRMFIRTHRPIMLDVLWEADEDLEVESSSPGTSSKHSDDSLITT